MMVDYDLGKVVGDKGETGNGIASITLHSTSGKVKTYRITYTDGSTFDFQVRDGNDASVTVDSALSSTSVNPVQNKVINSALNGKANSSHSHSISDVSSLQSSLDGKSDTGHTHTKSNITDFAHTHDDRYYTESETDTLLNGKASSSHSHSKSDITDFPSIPSASSTTPSADTVNGSVGTGSTYARSNHTHPKSSLYAEASHTHSIANVTDLQSSLDGKASTSHTHTKSEVTDFAHNHGQITNGGALTSSAVTVASGDFILITDVSNSNYIRKVSNLLAIHIKDSNAHSTIGSSANATQDVINSAIDTKIGDIETLIGDAITFINGTGGS